MSKASPDTHLLRELHVLASPVTMLFGVATSALWGAKIGPGLIAGLFSSLFVAATITFLLLAILRGKRLGVRIRLWSALLSGLVNAVAVGSVLLAFRIWYLQWPYNLGVTQPEDYIDDGGASWLITIGLVFLGSLIWALGIFAVGATPTKRVVRIEAAQ